MNIKHISKQTAQVLISYLTYQATQTVLSQLRENNPPLAYWLNQFAAVEKIQDGEQFLEELLKANQELAFRVMTVRAHLAEEVVDFLPEMTRSGIQQANMEHRRRYLERITQLSSDEPSSHPEQLESPLEDSDPSSEP